jgi:hypothetical protein
MQKKNVAIAIIAVGAMAAITLSILLLIQHTANLSTIKSGPVVTQTAQSVMTQLQKDVVATTILKESTVSLLSDKQSQMMYVHNPDINKDVQVVTTYGILITKDKAYTEQQLKVATNDLTTFLAKQGISTIQQTSDATALLTVSDKDLICQVKTLSSISGPVLQIQLLCIEKSSYDTQVSNISQLNKLWPAASSTSYDLLSLETVTKDSHTIALLYAIPKSTNVAHILIFAKTNDNWVYIGDAGAGTSVVANEKYVINQSIKDGLDNPNYGSLLHDILFGTTK